MVNLNYEGLSLESVPYYEKNRFWVSPMNYLPETYDMSEVQPQVQIHDVTLRDGEQTPEVVFKSDEKIHHPIQEKVMSLEKAQSQTDYQKAVFKKANYRFNEPVFYFIYNTEN